MRKGFILILGAVLVLLGYTYWQGEKLHEGVSEKLLRFHVIADSDAQVDQEVKLKVRDAVLGVMSGRLQNATSKSQASEVIKESLEEIEACANSVLAENGFAYKASASLDREYFPTKVYQSITLPPGEYDALVIRLGRAEGKNWWCVLFPTLCFVDNGYQELPPESRQKLKGILTMEEYEDIVCDEGERICIKSRIADKIKDLICGMELD